MTATASVALESLPVIDLSPLGEGPEGLAHVAAEIGRACRTIGFFYIRDHGISHAMLEDIYARSAAFFALPLAQKSALTIANSMNNRGYAGMESESLDPSKLSDAKEAFNIGRDPEPGEVTDPAMPSVGRNQWPDLPGFRAAMLGYYGAMRRLSERIHTAFALDLGLPPGFFADKVDRPLATLRLLRYPPHPGIFDGSRYGAGAHTDYGNLTLLSQDAVGGLEVRTRAGQWVSAPPIPDTYVCNIGDCLMRWSNDVYVSTPHRVANISGRERYSVAFFFDPNPDAVIECLPTCQSPDRPARYPPVTTAQYLTERLDATYAFRKDR
ncbi:isopenicillin N synthase family dioxygenase [Sphingomonas hengshuiensis]|uniref:2-oxoglutarate-dependent ethylene/succinate-forming enzyme n=1 Tax=Sphingomonas hengshuiensis TaxID=1609977 RepID=A0A7U4LEE2_9SPHN|nr:2-oxoglutarate and iron-dependent oxygenase domain-containing protein [Sphingomonas hengshuiensis]AJP71113.1 2OG-Fe(II) oxygenase [Sphingomonas hengshuiensis]